MIAGMGIVFCAFFYTLLIAFLFFSKNIYKSFETTIFAIIIFLSLINSIIEFWLCVNILLNVELYGFYNLLLNRLFLTFIFLFFLIFTIYIIYISFFNTKIANEKLVRKYGKNYIKKFICFFLPFFIIILLLLWFLPINLVDDGKYAYSDGPAVYVLYVVATLSIIVCFASMILNKRRTEFKKYAPFIVFITLFSILLIGRSINPGLLLNSFTIAFCTFVMYHTIENPDLKVIKQLYDSKETAERANNNKTTFMFNVVQRIRGPINNIKRFSNEAIKLDNKEELKEGLKAIKEETNMMEIIVNDVLDISAIDTKNLRVFKNKYNPSLLINEIISQYELNNKNEEVQFRKNIEKDLPKHLYGDSIKIKQILNTILYNSDKYTTSGFIEFRVSSVIKYDVCRLAFTVEDSGKGMSLEKSNKVLYNVGQDIDLSKIDTKDMNLPIVKKLVDLIGGTIILKSEENKGTTVTIVLDQKIAEHKTLSEEEKYSNVFKEKNKVLLIDENNNISKQLNKYVKNKNIEIETIIGGEAGLEKIRTGEIYNMIIINDNLEKIGAVNTFNKLKGVENFKGPVLVICDRKKGSDFLNIGFNDYIKKPLEFSQVEDVLNKYFKL